MTDTQILTIALAIIFPLGMLIYSNRSVSEAKETLRAELGRAEERLNGMLIRMDNKLDHIIETLADHTSRLEKLEK
jgi:hypothetical protein